MDRMWMITRSAFDRRQPKYIEGVKGFLDFSFNGKDKGDVMRCPCNNCLLSLFIDQDTMWVHLMQYGIKHDYNPWEFHGEDPISLSTQDEEVYYEGEFDTSNDDSLRDDMGPLLHEANNIRVSATLGSNSMGAEYNEGIDEMPANFQRLIKSAEEDLYPGCKTFSKLEFMITLLHIKVSHKWSDKSFSMLLNALHQAFDFDDAFPKNSYEAKKYTKDLGLNCVKIDACVNHCMLFRKEYANTDVCPICGSSRWKDSRQVQAESDSDEGEGSKMGKRIPHLVLRHFPLIPRLQRMFMSLKLASGVRWHKHNCIDDGILRHPADSKAWKFVDNYFTEFASDPRNVRLGLAADGFNPATQMSSAYSIWLVLLVPYNLPPWMCMKRENMILSLLIPGRKSPGNDIDVFLQPLIDELKDLWDVGVKTYDMHAKQTFNMKAMLMWTVNDFPAYANLSGWSTKGALACLNCHSDTKSNWLDKGHNYCYMHSRVFLPLDHKWREDTKQFGTVDHDPPPSLLKGLDIVQCLSEFRGSVTFGKAAGKRKRGDRYLDETDVEEDDNID